MPIISGQIARFCTFMSLHLHLGDSVSKYCQKKKKQQQQIRCVPPPRFIISHPFFQDWLISNYGLCDIFTASCFIFSANLAKWLTAKNKTPHHVQKERTFNETCEPVACQVSSLRIYRKTSEVKIKHGLCVFFFFPALNHLRIQSNTPTHIIFIHLYILYSVCAHIHLYIHTYIYIYIHTHTALFSALLRAHEYTYTPYVGHLYKEHRVKHLFPQGIIKAYSTCSALT